MLRINVFQEPSIRSFADVVTEPPEIQPTEASSPELRHVPPLDELATGAHRSSHNATAAWTLPVTVHKDLVVPAVGMGSIRIGLLSS
jgi:hypothetical protein